MLYAIISQDIENSLERRIGARPEHINRLNKLKDEGRLILAGPHPAIITMNLVRQDLQVHWLLQSLKTLWKLEIGPMLILMLPLVFIQV